jgi:hypothetical protein
LLKSGYGVVRLVTYEYDNFSHRSTRLFTCRHNRNISADASEQGRILYFAQAGVLGDALAGTGHECIGSCWPRGSCISPSPLLSGPKESRAESISTGPRVKGMLRHGPGLLVF